jgi:hypothetical protein
MFLQTTGGFGNQLFQWAYAHHILENQPNTRITVFSDKYHSSNRQNLLYLIQSECLHGIALKRKDSLGNIYRIVDKYAGKMFFAGEDWTSRIGIGTTENTVDIPRNIWLYRGYFQRPNLYWESIQACAAELESSLQQLAPRIPENLEFQVIHIRRTDYLQNMSTYGVLSREYYESVLDPSLNLIIVGDELELPKHFQNLGRNQKYFGPNSLNELETIALILESKLFIMANSTFSWWAALLAVRRNIKTIMPSPWHPNMHGLDFQITSPNFTTKASAFETSSN